MPNMRGYVDGVLIYQSSSGPDSSDAEMLLRSDFATTATTQDTYLMSGYEDVGDYGTGAVYTRVGATSDGPMAIQDANNVWFNLVIVDNVANVAYFGGKGDGVDDSAAMTAANDYLGSIGGGKWYLPSGHYKFTAPGAVYGSLYMYDNVEYCGDGFSSWYDNAGHNFANLNDSMNQYEFGSKPFYSISNIAAGAQSITCTTPANAANFSSGDIVLIHSSTLHLFLDIGEEIYTFQEVNVVVSANASTGVVTLADPITDKCTDAPRIGNFFTGDVPRNVHIRNMRITAGIDPGIQGIAFKFNGFYKGVIENCWIEATHGISVNGFIRSYFRNNNVTISTQGSFTVARAIELKFSTHNAIVENNAFQWKSRDGTWPSLICANYGEYARRVIDRGNVFYAPGQQVSVFGGSAAHGVIFENASVLAASVSKLAAYYNYVVENDDIPTMIRNIQLDVTGTVTTGLEFLNMSDLTVRDISVRNAVTGDALFLDVYSGSPALSVSNVLIENVHLNGTVNVAEVHSPVYSNVVIKGSSFTNTSFPSNMANNIVFENVRVFGTDSPSIGVLVTGTGTTPSVAGASIYSASDTPTITNFLNGVDGQSLYVVGKSGVTIANGTNIKTNTAANKSLAANRMYQYKLTGSTWIEVG